MKFVIDGNLLIVWYIVVYCNLVKFGNFKFGVGFVVDLGWVMKVILVKVWLVDFGMDILLWELMYDVFLD